MSNTYEEWMDESSYIKIKYNKKNQKRESVWYERACNWTG